MAVDMSTVPSQVRDFVLAVQANAKEAEMGDLADDIVHVEKKDDGSYVICDNYERFFSTIYTYKGEDQWEVRTMFSDSPNRPYTFSKCMSDASIMFTG